MTKKTDSPVKPLNIPKQTIEPEKVKIQNISDKKPDNSKKSSDAPRRVVFIVDRKLYNQDYNAIKKNLMASGELFCDERVTL